MPSMKHLLTLACAGILLVLAGGYVAQAATGPSYDPDALRLALAWERIKFQVEDPGELLNQMNSLGQQADALAEQHPDNTEILIWDGIITSERASLANEHGGLTGPVRALQ